MHRVVIVGGGFGGLFAAKSFRGVPVDVTLVDRRNHHLFQPLLYQVATGGLSPANIAAPLRALLKRQQNVTVLLDEVVGFEVEERTVILRDGELPYDTLILAAGSSHSYFGHDEWGKFAPGLKSIENATQIRRMILYAFEQAEKLGDCELARPWMTFVIVGAGPTGVELAGAIAELAHQTLRADFRRIDPRRARILLVEAGNAVLSHYPPKLSGRAKVDLESLGVEVWTGAMVTDVDHQSVTIRRGDQLERIETRAVLWAAGVQASPLAQMIGEATGAAVDRGGRVVVGPELTLPGHPEIIAIGDMANCLGADGKPLPALAPVAMQQGEYAAKLVRDRLSGDETPPFRYHDWGTMATIGGFKAVADLRGFRLTGLIAWLTWLFVHLMQIVQFENRVLVLVQWAWNYTTRNRSARLITGEDVVLVPQEPGGVRLEEEAVPTSHS